jgi:hypothetical protein
MGNKNSVLKKYNYIDFLKVKLLNLCYKNNKVYLLICDDNILLVNRLGDIVYKILYNDIISINVSHGDMENNIDDKIIIKVLNGNVYIINTYKNIKDNMIIKDYLISSITKQIRTTYKYGDVEYSIDL